MLTHADFSEIWEVELHVKMIQVRSSIVLASCIMGICVGAWEIDTDNSTKEPLLVDLGQSFSLQCTVKETNSSAQDNWKMCTWSRENDLSQCVFTYRYRFTPTERYEIQKDCQGAINDTEFVGSEDIQEHNFVCGMKFEEASDDDIAGWTCDIEQCAETGCKTSEGSGTKANATINVMVKHCGFQITISFGIICTICI